MNELPRREREIFEILCSRDGMTAAVVRERMQDAPSYSAVRALLSRLEGRGLVTHIEHDQTYVYRPVHEAESLRRSALAQMVRTFFDGSAVGAATALLGLSHKIEDKELASLEQAIAKARKRAK